MITDVAWDFDGTLCDSYPYILRCFQKALRDFGIADDEKRMLGRIKTTVGRAACLYGAENDIPPETILLRFQSYNAIPDYRNVRPYPGVLGCLAFVTAHGGRNHLYTHRHKEVHAYLSKFGMTPYFVSFITGDDGFPQKPAPDALRSLLDRFAISKDHLMMIGDRPIDIEAGWNAGCATCFFNSNEFPIPPHATYATKKYDQLQKILEGILPSSS